MKVEKTVPPLSVDGITYPAGTYIVNMHQAKRGYVNLVCRSTNELLVIKMAITLLYNAGTGYKKGSCLISRSNLRTVASK
ncbi:hypothetical protein A3844_20850 [Paenibacillus helianthi]|uniref:Uncharacterized protein n=1 Tax=Paenibacillus helianthi TaxID=1349432 RepID=A0ABX3EKU8_9BACL|nr:hypothetical protein [Paenibacillus sp. P3E]OKP68296.1 hypothetical protein A3842_27085 [Paenibacillus sp. P3E]OKP83930.1 hypothetical protein A3844_20850 [Paenibacillus helianthi]